VASLYSTDVGSHAPRSTCLHCPLSRDYACNCRSTEILLLTIYRLGSARVTSTFYDELSTVLESLVLQCGPVMVGGDINIHVKDAADADAACLAAVFDAFDMQQHVVSAIHNLGSTLDIVATFSGYCIDSLTVDPPGMISDHSLITCCLPAHHHSSLLLLRIVRSWHKVDRSEFAQAVKEGQRHWSFTTTVTEH